MSNDKENSYDLSEKTKSDSDENLSADDIELSEDDLDAVSGGWNERDSKQQSDVEWTWV